MAETGQEPQRVFNVKVVVTVVFCLAYVGVLVWAVIQGKLDAASFSAGIGPTFGVVIKDWFSGNQ